MNVVNVTSFLWNKKSTSKGKYIYILSHKEIEDDDKTNVCVCVRCVFHSVFAISVKYGYSMFVSYFFFFCVTKMKMRKNCWQLTFCRIQVQMISKVEWQFKQIIMQNDANEKFIFIFFFSIFLFLTFIFPRVWAFNIFVVHVMLMEMQTIFEAKIKRKALKKTTQKKNCKRMVMRSIFMSKAVSFIEPNIIHGRMMYVIWSYYCNLQCLRVAQR